MSSPYYLDLNFPVDVHYGFDPAASGQNLIELEDGLLEDPRLAHVARGIAWTRQWREDEPVSERGGGTVLGGEACLWGELVTDEVLDVRLWTRLPALAERFWSAAELADTTDLHRRLDIYLDEFHPLRGRDLAAWTAGKMHQLAIESRWRPLTDMLEPVKWYGRLLGAEALEARIEGREMPQSRPYGVHSSLDRLIDHLPVESRVARELTALCRRTVEGDEQATEMLRARAQDWLELGEQSAEALAELQQPAERLARLGELIIERLAQDLKVAPELLDEIGSPMNEMMIALPPGLRNWLTNS